MSFSLQAHRELVGRHVRTARRSAGLSHDALAAAVGTSRQHLIKIEQGTHLPREGMLRAIAAATGRDESFFESEDDEEDDQVGDLLEALRRLVRAEVQKSHNPSTTSLEAAAPGLQRKEA